MQTSLFGNFLWTFYDFYQAVVDLDFFAVEREIFYFGIFVYSMVVLKSLSQKIKKESELLPTFAMQISTVLGDKKKEIV